MESMNDQPLEVIPTSVSLEWAVAHQSLDERHVSGDQYVVRFLPDRVVVAVIDGLGHGSKAADAALAAVQSLQTSSLPSVIPLMKRCHEDLLRTRGAVISLASFHPTEGTLTWLGVGNVEGLLCHANGSASHERLLLSGGVVGYRLPTLRAVVLPLAPGDTLIFATDGIRSNFSNDLPLTLSPQAIADHILAQHRRGTDDALVLVARYVGNTSE